MNTSMTTTTADTSIPVLTDFAEASRPQSEIALRLMAEAMEQSGKLTDGRDKKAGTLRILASGRGDLFHLNPYLVTIEEGWNSRVANDPDNIAHIDALARSIAAKGVLQALTVVLKGDKVVVIDGHCRLLATFRAIEVYGAEIKSIPLSVESRLASEADRVLGQILRNGGKPLTVMEQGSVFVKLIGFGWTVKQIAEKAGLGTVRVSQVLDLIAESNDAIRELVNSGQVSATLAQETLREANGDAVAAEQVLTEARTVARAHGKTRITKKHIKAAGEVVKPNTKTALQTIFLSRSTKVDVASKVTIVMTVTNWNEVSRLLKLER